MNSCPVLVSGFSAKYGWLWLGLLCVPVLITYCTLVVSVCMGTDPWSWLHAAHWLSRFVRILILNPGHILNTSFLPLPTLLAHCTVAVYAWILIPDSGCTMHTGFLRLLGTHPGSWLYSVLWFSKRGLLVLSERGCKLCGLRISGPDVGLTCKHGWLTLFSEDTQLSWSLVELSSGLI